MVLLIGFDSFSRRTHQKNFMLQINHLVQQPDDITCGPTTVCMLMYFYGIDISVDEIKKITKTVWYKFGDKDVGMTTPQMINYSLNNFGLKSKIKYGNIDNLKHKINDGSPCIVLVRSGEWNWHYVLVHGYDENFIFYANPSSGELEGLATDEFVGAWSWTSDLRGRSCGILPKYLLKSLEIYPNSFISVGD